jgi:hypothetical protein
VRVSGSLFLLSMSLFIVTQTLGILQSFTHHVPALPQGVSMVWMPLSQLFAPIMLIALAPSDRMGTLFVALLLCILCLYYFIALPAFFWASGMHGTVITTRCYVMTVCFAFWGCGFFQQGPAAALLSLWRLDDRWDLNPRASLNGLWWVWRASTITFAAVDTVFALTVAIWRGSDGHWVRRAD